MTLPTGVDVRPDVVGPPMLVADFTAVFANRLDDDIAGDGGARCRGGRAVIVADDLAVAQVVGDQREVVAGVQVGAERIAAHGLEDEVVLGPAEPARFDVEADMRAVADELLADEPAVIDLLVRADDKAEVPMAPGLRHVPGGGDVRRAGLGRVASQYWRCCRTIGPDDRGCPGAHIAKRTGKPRAARQRRRWRVRRDDPGRRLDKRLGSLSRYRYR